MEQVQQRTGQSDWQVQRREECSSWQWKSSCSSRSETRVRRQRRGGDCRACQKVRVQAVRVQEEVQVQGQVQVQVQAQAAEEESKRVRVKLLQYFKRWWWLAKALSNRRKLLKWILWWREWERRVSSHFPTELQLPNRAPTSPQSSHFPTQQWIFPCLSTKSASVGSIKVNEANSRNPLQVIRQSISINDFKIITIFFSYSTILHI